MRMIDADALGVGRCSKDILPAAYCAGWNGLIGLIEKAPTIDAVPVVRCRECKYRFKNNGHDKSGCPIIDNNIWMDDDDFCSHGERKEGKG